MSRFPDLKVRWLFKTIFFFSFSGLAVATVAGVGLWHTLWPTLPDVETLRDVELQTPLRIYSRDGKLIREFGEKRRVPLTVAETPEAVKHAVIATEDSNFYSHQGVDPIGIARAVVFILREGRKGPGGSTITMQVARNFFLDRGKTYLRKLTEIMLAFKIEQELTKDEILELYLNKIFMGHRAYGVGAAAQVYYGKTIDELTLAQLAMIAGLPQRPSDFNPISNPAKAKARRDHVLWRMHKVGWIDTQQYQTAKTEPLTAQLHDPPVEVEAPYLAEMVRLEIKQRYGEAVFAKGYRVYTSIDSPLQATADQALRKALIEYDQRHGWRGPELQLTLGETVPPQALDRLLADVPRLGGLAPAIVLNVGDASATVYAKRIGKVTIDWPQMRWARKKITVDRVGKQPKKPSDIIARGDVIRVQSLTLTDKKTKQQRQVWALSQLPDVEGAFVALDPIDGRVVALTGGLDFNRSKFNRVTQARRQPGSSFKPFIYSAAIEKGLTAATTINDAPVVFNESDHADTAWRPKNSSGKSYGPTRLRTALSNSRNLVSIRLLDRIGIDYALKHVERFGLDPSKLPRDLSLSLGSGVLTPMELATGYSVLANGGFGVTPYFITRVETGNGEVLDEAAPLRACPTCQTHQAKTQDDPGDSQFPAPKPGYAPRTLAPENAWIMYSMMKDVIRYGTGKRATQLKRKDLAGKTGTTNEGRDAWFSGFNGALVATAWVGFDKLKSLGKQEYGGKAALPMWMYFMGEALKGMPETPLTQPKQMVRLRINAETGLLAKAGDPDAIFETFRPDYAPDRHSGRSIQREAQKVYTRIW